MTQDNRQSTGIEGLDALLGGGLLPGTLTVVVGATGIGKTQFGVQFADAGRTASEKRRGFFFDMNSRGDSQSHAEYAKRICDWDVVSIDARGEPDLDHIFDADFVHGDYLHVFDYHGRRVTRRDLEFEQWQEWQAELNVKLAKALAFLYGNFISGKRRLVVDGIEPVSRPSDSVQLNLFEFVYHQIVHKDPQWVARDVFRQFYRISAENIAKYNYVNNRIGTLLLYTSHEAMLEDLISRPLDEGDLLSGANTVIYLGKVRDGIKIHRSLYIAKHRGSACSEQIVPYTIGDKGIAVHPE